MSNYLYLPQQSEEYFKAHNKNDLDFIELNPLSFCLICFSIEKQSNRQFQDFWNWFLNEHLTETYTTYTTYYFDQAYFEDDFKKRNNNIQTALRQRNNTLLLLFRDDAQDPIEWLDDFEKAATTNQYNNEYKFQIVGGYLQGSPATWFSQETNANTQQRIIK
ncbi:hypothetical protein G9A89_009748 [Geosiphon pyriformis]|nr:hypothetical protein G9A89_009748 [Geosiphon pyriformis]